MGPNIAAAAALLVPGAELAAVAFACTSASVTIHNDFVSGAIAQERSGVPVVTPSSAALAGLKALSARRIAILTPYLRETTGPIVNYFEANDIEVKRAGCFGLADDTDMARLDPETIIDAAVSLGSADVDAVFLSCTAMPALDVIDEIEARLDKPALCSNQATFWAMRGIAGLPPRADAVGRLFQCPVPDWGIIP
nr:aspartate/glutamate racemase family protein [Marivita sp. GX14005]